jgi:hypothetical protein
MRRTISHSARLPRLLPLSNIAFAIILRCCCFPSVAQRFPTTPFIALAAAEIESWWTGKDSNLRSPQGAADLQSAGFSHSPTRPRKHVDTKCVRSFLENRYCPGAVRENTKRTRVQRHQPFHVIMPGFAPPHSPDEIWWSWRRELNPRPSDYKSDALPAELRQRCSNRTRIAD